MPVFRHVLVEDDDNPVVMLADDLPLLDESICASSLHYRVGNGTAGEYLREVHRTLGAKGAWEPGSGRFALFSGNTKFRNFMNAVLRRRKCQVRGGKGFVTVTHPTQIRSINRLLIALKAFEAEGFEIGILHGQRSFERDGYRTRDADERRRDRANTPKTKSAEGQFIRDTGRYWRIPHESWMPPRTSDVRWLVDIVKALVAAGKDPSVVLPIRMAGSTIARIGEIMDANAWGWWKASRLGDEILLRNKHQGQEPRKRANLVEPFLSDFMLYFDGSRHQHCLHGYTLKRLRELGERADRGGAKGRRAEAELRSIRLFINRRGAPMTYDNLVTTHLAPVLRAASIPATAHWIRHEVVHRRLREIDQDFLKHEDVSRWNADRQELSDYMGWKTGTKMFEVYDAFHMAGQAHRGARGAAARLAAEVAAHLAGGTAGDPPAGDAGDADEVADFKAYMTRACTIANDFEDADLAA